jgi:hypothetical protein
MPHHPGLAELLSGPPAPCPGMGTNVADEGRIAAGTKLTSI